jgi:NADP-dependent 3-hydroxy acid dehydrogenase YdfG
MHPRGKVCVVTGAASSIGEAVARAYAEAGVRSVVVADLNAEKLAKVAQRRQADVRYTPTAAKTARAELLRGQGCAANRTPPGPISPGKGALNL